MVYEYKQQYLVKSIEYLKVDYLGELFQNPKTLINNISLAIKRIYPNCGGLISGSGLSGSSILVPVAIKLNLPFLFVRDKKTHCLYSVEGHRVNNAVIIDDCIESGTTMRRLIKRTEEHDINISGILLYDNISKSIAMGKVLYKHKFSYKNKDYPLVEFNTRVKYGI
jgi:adenine/guanine phosphoribosyltransferase-like PRPP-binding protein